MLRAGLGFLLALILSAAICGLALSRLAVAPTPASAPAETAPSDSPNASAPTPAPEPMRHLPDWVQTRHPATLWSGPDANAQAFSQLAAWTFLQVDGVDNDRLHVEYAGDGQSQQPGPGWVALDDVQPSDPSGTWLRNHRASQLSQDPTGTSSVAQVPQWSTMLELDATTSPTGRLHVRLYTPDLRGIVGDGWIAGGDVGPSGPPRAPVYTGARQAPPTPYVTHDDFLNAISAAAVSSEAATGVPASVTVAQAILESDWGTSALSREANNYFGIKALGQVGDDGAVWMDTLEAASGGTYRVVAPFRAYKSLTDSVADHARVLQLPRYADALQVENNPDEFARRIASAGYSTDPNYAAKLIALMQQLNLYRFTPPA